MYGSEKVKIHSWCNIWLDIIQIKIFQLYRVLFCNSLCVCPRTRIQR